MRSPCRAVALVALSATLLGVAHAQHRIVNLGGGSSNLSNPASFFKNVASVAAGQLFNVALFSDGTLTIFGSNSFGTAPPVGLKDIKAVACGANFGLALRNDGAVVAWGPNTTGAIDVPNDVSKVVAVSGGLGHALALLADGSVRAWGLNDLQQTTIPIGLNSVKAISAGLKHNLALRSDGTVVAWGDNTNGQCNVPVGLVDVAQVAAGFKNSYALKADGTIVGWGSSASSMLPVPAEAAGAKQIAVGSFHAVALLPDGKLVTWGSVGGGQDKVMPGMGRIKEVVASQNITLGLVEDYVEPVVMPTVIGGSPTRMKIALPVAVPDDGKFYRIQLQAQPPVTVNELPQLLSPGQTTVTFVADVESVDNEAQALVTGRLLRFATSTELNFADGSSQCVAATLTVRPASLAKIEVLTDLVAGGSNAQCKVSLNGPAGPSGADVVVASLNTALAGSPGVVNIAPDSQSRTFNVSTNPVDLASVTTLRAQYAGLTRTTTLGVHPAVVHDVVLNAAAVSGGVSITGNEVVLQGVAGPAGVEIVLASSHPGIASVPQTLTIASGKSKASFKVETRTVGSPKVVTIFAIGNGHVGHDLLTVNP